MPEDSDDDDPDEVYGFITMLNLTERKVTPALAPGDSGLTGDACSFKMSLWCVSAVGRVCNVWRR